MSSRKYLAEKYGKIALREFKDLKQEAEAKGTLDDFYFQIESYLELVYFSFAKSKKFFLREPQVPPTLADFDIYNHASQDLYKDVFKILKKNIPKDNVESNFRSMLEDYFDELLERLKAYF
ncbi:MAG: hypothetical protein HC830_04090 [Bacteroidetes bacterium]|nr:hypothetical protein [Bacteroidota bacterium]